MLLRILAVGDVVSEAGLAYLERRLRRIQQEHNVDFTVVNGENAAGIGVLPWQAQAILDAGADVVTLGNHTWGKLKIHDFLDDCRACLRPANFAPELPGNGWGIFESVNGLRVGVINLIGRVSMDPNVDNPFRKADAILEQMKGQADVVVWISTQKPPVRSWPWAGIWTGGFPPSGAPTPTSPRRMVRFCPRAPASSPTWG